ncbi:MAG: hypothetical protein OXR66_08625 [Candidatus Woesearchaeota archaeon]|nr:hypothetical protein [Candidatus Woesearchaeota archaeon]
MKSRNIWEQVPAPLELHEDARGKIVDVFYNDDIAHVAVIVSAPDVVRGNHYHKQTTQHMLITKGAMEYWQKPVASEEPATSVLLKKGDLITTPPNEIHAMKTLEETEFIVFTSGIRGGKDYEQDTFRVDSIVPE